MQDDLAALRAFVGRGDRDLDAELVRSVCLALADALDLGRVPGIELPDALPLLLGAELMGHRNSDRFRSRRANSLESPNVKFWLFPEVGAVNFKLAVGIWRGFLA